MISKTSRRRSLGALAFVALAIPMTVGAQTTGAVTKSAAAAQKAPIIRTLTEQEMIDLMVGSGIQATRATTTDAMIQKVREAFAQGRKFQIVDPDTIGDDWTVALPGAVGGGGAWEFVATDVEKAKVPKIDNPSLTALEELGKYTGRKVDAIIRAESAEATLSAFMDASALGVPLVDACLSARARPETQQSIPESMNVKRSDKMAGVSQWGDVVLFDQISAPIRGEHLMRALAVASGGVIYLASQGYTGAEIKRATIHGSISQAILWGRTVREAKEKGKDPIDALTKVAKGYRLFQGVVSKAEVKGDKGFTYWDVEMKGSNQFAGHTYKIYVKNENIVTWLDGKPDAMSPDFISNLDPVTGAAIGGGHDLGAYTVGKEIAMVGIPSSPMWRTPRGIDLMGPRHYGFDFDFAPVEDQMKRRSKL